MEETKKCPYCGEEIQASAQKCRFCGEWLSQPEEEEVKEGFLQYYWGEVCRKHLFDFKGSLGRKDYWCAVLALAFMQFCMYGITIFGAMAGTTFKMILAVGATIASLVLSVTSIALAVRRLHDTNRSGWWVLLSLVPLVGPIAVLVMLCQPGQTPSHRVKANAGDWLTLGILVFTFFMMLLLMPA